MKALLPRRANRCALGNEPFLNGETYISHIIENKEDYDRYDYCIKCAPKIEKKGKVHVWQGKIPKKEEQISIDEKGLNLLRDLALTETDLAALTLLVFSLCRKKQLVKINAHHYEVPHTGELFTLKLLSLKPEAAEVGMQRLQILLNERSA